MLCCLCVDVPEQGKDVAEGEKDGERGQLTSGECQGRLLNTEKKKEQI